MLSSKQRYIQLRQQADELYRQELYDEAILVIKEACDLARSAFGDKDSNYSRCLKQLALFYVATGNISASDGILDQLNSKISTRRKQ